MLSISAHSWNPHDDHDILNIFILRHVKYAFIINKEFTFFIRHHFKIIYYMLYNFYTLIRDKAIVYPHYKKISITLKLSCKML